MFLLLCTANQSKFFTVVLNLPKSENENFQFLIFFAYNIPWPLLLWFWPHFPRNNIKNNFFCAFAGQVVRFIFHIFKSKWLPVLHSCVIPMLQPLFVRVPYTINLINISHSVNLTISMVTSIYNIQKISTQNS